MKATLENIRELVHKTIDEGWVTYEDIKLDTPFYELGFDDLDEMVFTMNCEKHFNIVIPEKVEYSITTVQQAIDEINKLIKQ
jgi:acyl carrier protein